MQYMLMCCFDEKAWEAFPEPQKDKVMEEYGKFIQGIVKSGHSRAGGELPPGAYALAGNVGEVYRREYGRVLATLIRTVGSFDLAEDALQDAFEAALSQWPAMGP